jgi:hypothetical protein
MRRLLVLCSTVVLLFAVAACSDDGDDDDVTTEDSAADGASSAGSGTFCADAEANLALLEGDTEALPDDEDLEQLDQLAASASPEVQEDFETVREGYEQLAGLDQSDPDSIELVFDVLFDPELVGAFEQVATYLEDECGFDVESPAESGLDDDDEADDDDDGSDGDEVSSDTVRGFLESEAPEIEERVQSIGSFSGVELTVGVVELDDPAEAVEICELLSTYVYEEAGAADTTIKVQDTGTTDLAVREGEDGSCEAA